MIEALISKPNVESELNFVPNCQRQAVKFPPDSLNEFHNPKEILLISPFE